MEKKFLTYHEVFYVIDFCMTDRSLSRFFDSIITQDADMPSCFNYHKISDLKRFHSTIDDDAVYLLQTSVDYDTLKEHIYADKYDEALSLLNSALENAGFKDKFKDIRNDLPHLIIETLLFANAYYINHREDIDKVYENRQYVSPKEPKEITSLRKLSAEFAKDNIDRRNRYKLTDNLIIPGLLSEGSLPVMGKHKSEKKDLMEFMKDDSDLLITGEGGIGKSTFLFHVLDEYSDRDDYIPFYFSLTELKAYGDDSNKRESHYIKDAFDKKISDLKIKNLSFEKIQNSPNDSMPRLLLLLDGINEISNDNNSYHRKKLMDEIERLSENDNFRIIATSRPFNNSDSYLPNAVHIEATGLDIKTIKSYLKRSNLNDDIDYGTPLAKILSIPLFLLMYIRNGKHGKKKQDSKGAILYEFFNSETIDDYTEAFIQKELSEIDRDMPNFLAPLNDFVFPTIASQMHQGDSLFISLEYLTKLLDDVNDICVNSMISPDNHYRKYTKDLLMPSEYAKNITYASLQKINIREIITDRLSFLQPDHKSDYSFLHQHIRDYFAAIMNLNAILLPSDKFTEPYLDAFNYGWTSDVIEFMKDVYLYEKDYISVDNILEKMQFFSADDHKSFIAISNLFALLSAIYDMDLSSISFDGIDFSRCNLSSVNFHNPLEGTDSTFNSCIFSKDSFQTRYAHDYSIFYDFYENKPAIIECYGKEKTLTVIFKDLISGYQIASYTYVFDNVDLSFCHVDDAVVSCDHKHISFEYSEHGINPRRFVICDFMIDEKRSCKRNVLFVSDFFPYSFSMFYMSNGNLVIATELPSFNVYSFDPISVKTVSFDPIEINDPKYISISNVENRYYQISDYKYLSFHQVLENYGSNSYIFFTTFDIIKHEFKISPTPIAGDLYKNLCIDGDNLYLYDNLRNLYILDLESLEIKDKIDLSTSINRVLSTVTTLNNTCTHNGYIYIGTLTCMIKINTNDYSDIDLLNFDTNSNPFIELCSDNDSYIVYRGFHLNAEAYLIFRIEQGTFSFITNFNKTLLEYSFYDDIIPLIYSNGQVALVSNNNLGLIDIFHFHNTNDISYAYDPINKLLALYIEEADYSFAKTVYIFNIDSGFNLIQRFRVSSKAAFVFDGISNHLYVHTDSKFSLYKVTKDSLELLAEKKTELKRVQQAELNNDKVIFIGHKTDISFSFNTTIQPTVYCLSYTDNNIVIKSYTAPILKFSNSIVSAIHSAKSSHNLKKNSECIDIYFKKNNMFFSFMEPHSIELFNPDDPNDTQLIDIDSLNHLYISSASKYDEIIPRTNDSFETDYTFSENSEGLVIYCRQNHIPVTILPNALYGGFTHVKDSLMITAYKDYSLFKYDLKELANLGSTKFIPDVNIVNSKIINPICSDEVINILKENGADLQLYR